MTKGDLRRSLIRILEGTKPAVEPATAAPPVALTRLFNERLRSRQVGNGGINIDPEILHRHLAKR